MVEAAWVRFATAGPAVGADGVDEHRRRREDLSGIAVGNIGCACSWRQGGIEDAEVVVDLLEVDDGGHLRCLVQVERQVSIRHIHDGFHVRIHILLKKKIAHGIAVDVVGEFGVVFQRDIDEVPSNRILFCKIQECVQFNGQRGGLCIKTAIRNTAESSKTRIFCGRFTFPVLQINDSYNTDSKSR